MSSTKPTTYTSLKALLEAWGSETPHQFGRALYKYASCGPNTAFLLNTGSRVNYADLLAHTSDPEEAGWWARVVGVHITSIVEGSDAEIDSTPLMFPFTDQDLEQTIQYVNAEACAAWDEANG